MSHAQGNDMAAQDSDATTNSSNPPEGTPTTQKLRTKISEQVFGVAINEVRPEAFSAIKPDAAVDQIMQLIQTYADTQAAAREIEARRDEIRQLAQFLNDPAVTKLSLLRIVNVRWKKLLAGVNTATSDDRGIVADVDKNAPVAPLQEEEKA